MKTLDYHGMGISHGKVWQLLSYALLHGDWVHLVINLFILWFAGGRVMQMLGQRKSLEIIAAGVLVGGLLHLLSGLLPVTGYGESYLVGISGACFALLLAMATLSPHTRLRIDTRKRQEPWAWPRHRGSVIVVDAS